MRDIPLPDGSNMPALGLGTWHIGESRHNHADEVRALRSAFEIGYRLIDTAEMYGEGGAERVIGEAVDAALVAGDISRDDLFVVSKVYPHNASRTGTLAACERSLTRLQLDTIDLYLLHWPGTHPLIETVEAFETLRSQGKIRHWGVSNFDVDDLETLWALTTPHHRAPRCSVNQVYYSASTRGIEFSMMPLLQSHHVPVMAYTPTDQGELGSNRTLSAIGKNYGVSGVQVALAWVLSHPLVAAIPKAVKEAHLRENWAAATLTLSPDDMRRIDQEFPPPQKKRPLAML